MKNLPLLKKTVHSIQVVSFTEQYTSKLRKILNYLKETDRKSYQKVIKLLKTIYIPAAQGYINGTFVEEKIWITEGELISTYPYQYLASHLVHEAHHIAQHRAGYAHNPQEAERHAYKVQRRYLKKIVYPEAIEWLDKEYKAKWWQDKHPNVQENDILKQYLTTYKKEVSKT